MQIVRVASTKKPLDNGRETSMGHETSMGDETQGAGNAHPASHFKPATAGLIVGKQESSGC
jgi:hypothetical protein